MEALKLWCQTLIEKTKQGLVDVRDDVQGATMVEYSILIGLLTAAVVAAIALIGGYITTQWQALCTAVGVAGC